MKLASSPIAYRREHGCNWLDIAGDEHVRSRFRTTYRFLRRRGTTRNVARWTIWDIAFAMHLSSSTTFKGVGT